MRMRLLRAAVVAAVAGLAAPAAHADLIGGLVGTVLPTCGATSQPFADWGDDNSYYAVPNNGLEGGSTGWQLSGGAKVVPGNEPFYVGGPGNRSLFLPSGSVAYSPAACINLLDPSIRLFAADAGGSDDGLSVQVIFRGLLGNVTGVLNYGTVSPGGEWQPTQPIASILALPLGTRYFQVRFAPVGSGSRWQIDDLFVDPWVSGIG